MNEVVRAEDKSMFENEFLNAPFEECEVMRVLEKLKNGKAAGPDLFINEFFKYSADVLCGALTRMFNVVLLSGTLAKFMVLQFYCTDLQEQRIRR